MGESELSKFKLHYEYTEDYPEIMRAIRRAKYKLSKNKRKLDK